MTTITKGMAPKHDKHTAPSAAAGIGKRKRVEAEEDNSSLSRAVPIRDVTKLYCQGATIRCAFRKDNNLPCVPCSYKVGLFDVALDTGLTKMVPNQRPEQCPRISSMSTAITCTGQHGSPPTMKTGTLGYRSNMHVLTVGDGDLTFSLCLARFLCRSGGRVLATSYESKETCGRVYPQFLETVAELQTLGAELKFQVDATDLKASIAEGGTTKFDRIVWNFPCTAIAKGQDGQNDAMEQNKKLVRAFVKSAIPLLDDEGEIHMCHKTKPPFNQWRIEDVVMDAVGAGTKAKLHYHGRVVLDRATLPPYVPRKALDKKSFPCHDACTYVFSLMEPTDITSTKSMTIPPNAAVLTVDNMDSLQDTQIVPVNANLILRLRSRMLLHASKSKAFAMRHPSSKKLKIH